MTTTDRQPTTPDLREDIAYLVFRAVDIGDPSRLAAMEVADQIMARLDAAPTTYSLPPEPPPEVTMLLDRDGEQYCRLDSPLPTGESWVHRDTPLDEVHINEEAVHWRELLVDHGPLSTVPPERTEASGDAG